MNFHDVKVLIAPDKFKGSLTAQEVCETIRAGLQPIDPSLKITALPLADGGEGTCDLLTYLDKGKRISVKVYDPLMREIHTYYGLSADGNTAFIEMAHASGLQLLQPGEANCMIASSYGTGQMIQQAISRGAKKIIMGIGGSATMDGGLGMAEALGYKLFSSDNKPLTGNGENLAHLNRIDSTEVFSLLQQTTCIVLCDVDNPLCGEQGAARVFARQKGARDEEIEILEKGLSNFSRVASTLGVDFDFPGAGAAGGMGAGAALFLNAAIKKGTDFIFDHIQLDSKIAAADLIITGEGKLDTQTFSGKVVQGVARLAAQHRKPLLVVAGCCTLDKAQIQNMGISHLIVLADEHVSVKQAMAGAAPLLQKKIAAWFQQNGRMS